MEDEKTTSKEEIVQEQLVQEEFVSKEDMNTLSTIKSNLEKLMLESKLAISRCDFEDLKYKYTITQIYLKYGLKTSDKINDDGRIARDKKDNK